MYNVNTCIDLKILSNANDKFSLLWTQTYTRC